MTKCKRCAVRKIVPNVSDVLLSHRHYRCRKCGAVFNIFTNTIWSKSRYSCATIVLILRGVAQGVPTAHLARELGIDRTHLLERRHEIQRLIEQRFLPSGTAGQRG
jgi:transposase-like protein